jgi:hypothetical protein
LSWLFRGVALVFVWIVALLCIAWAAGALAFDSFLPGWGTPVAILYVLASLALIILVPGHWRKLCAILAAFVVVLVWWRMLKPSNDRPWQPDVARTAWAEMAGDTVTLHNVRNCDYRSETDYTARWEDRTVRLSQLTGVDLAITYWGSPWMAHPIASFQFADAAPVCFSIETRKEIGEGYSAVAGLYRQFELIYIAADERDVIRLRTNFRSGEDVYLYRTTASAEQARGRFLEYVSTLNDLHTKPRWYNALTTNCTTTIRSQHDAAQRAPWDWRLLANGKADELMFERGMFATGGLSFPELKRRVHINAAAVHADSAADFSKRIRAGVPGF